MSAHSPDDNPVLRTRVGNAERDAVVEQLHEAAAEGRLELDELTERIESALQAKTFADLDPLVADLPTVPPSQAYAAHNPGLAQGGFPPAPASSYGAAAGHVPVPAQAAGSSPDNPFELSAGMEDTRRRGRWTVPAYLRSDPSMATVEWNFLEASTPHSVISLDVTSSWGTTLVVVPEDWGVNVDGLKKTWGSIRSKVAVEPRPGNPLIRVTGNVGWGTFSARHANWWDRQRLGR
ncbi:DUF1707 SHOCT-like domain-containing protein [Sediminivirga luteola]|uniref:DUF1707 SHOCT-like domain-containing protein n=1 Tax=Sediminivirga luteola TaxID=1774748 RepID=UPI001F55B76E|nr:DUF1707 domain-containing protein [Sediminivirga luteola]MCI2267142.1 DUF1707 domain-containing protein [Sediminivirga luteola]